MNVVDIAVDAMGDVHAPEEIVAGEIVAGAFQGTRDFNLRVSLIGDPAVI